jgi:hypothetical protein
VGDEATGLEVEADFAPNLTINRWDNEVSMKLKPIGIDSIPVDDKKVSFEDNKVKFETPKIDYHLYDLPVSEVNPEGAYEFEVILNEKPATNKVEFSIETQGLDFFYQPALNVEMASSTCTETDCGNKHRPENVVGSYAVYASENKVNYIGGKEYKTGKVGHFYRPRIMDSAGTEVWGVLSIDKDKGILIVTIPQEFLDTAVYPVRHAAGLTFGYGSIGASEDGDSWYPNVNKAYGPPASNGILESVSIYAKIDTGSPVFSTALYSDVSGTPTNRLAYVNAGTAVDVSYGWVTTNLYYNPITMGTQYWLGHRSNSTARFLYKYDTGSSGENFYNSGTTVFADPWSGSSSSAQRISIYATYAVPTGPSTLKLNSGTIKVQGGTMKIGNDIPIAAPLAIGDSYQGGIIAYIDGTGLHGLISAASDQSGGALWGCRGTTISGADGTAVGTGDQNTIDIEAGCATAGTAADICANLSLNTYSDWYLPSKDELNKLYLSRVAIGGFSGVYYWTSSETFANYAWGQAFTVAGTQNNMVDKANAAVYVRCTRTF